MFTDQDERSNRGKHPRIRAGFRQKPGLSVPSERIIVPAEQRGLWESIPEADFHISGIGK